MNKGDVVKVSFTVVGEPKSKGRPRFTRSGRTYTPKDTIDAERVIADAWRRLEIPASDKPMVLVCDFYVGTLRRKDIDNMLKTVGDALNGVAYVDDSQLVGVVASKTFTVPGRSRSVISLIEVEGSREDW